jgi:hypothetical protein
MTADVVEAAPLPTHIILKIKRYPDGVAGRFKARIVAGGDHQVYASVVDFTLLRVVLYIALSLQTYMAQVDVKTAFLNGNLNESVFAVSPCAIDNHPSRMYKMTKALHRLKQTQLARNTRLCADLVSMGFTELPSALCVYMRRTGSVVVVILVYVDDLGIFSSSRQVPEDVVGCLGKLCELRALHGMTPFLDVQIDWSTSGHVRRMSTSQPGYVLSVLRRFQMHDGKPVGTPMIPGFFAALAKETRIGDQVVDLEQYQPMIRYLPNLGRRTRPDTLAPVRILTRFCKVADVVLPQGSQADPAFLRGTWSHTIQCVAGSLGVSVFVASDHAADTITRRSITGVMLRLGAFWGCKKRQHSVDRSTCGAKHCGMTTGAHESLWIGRILRRIGWLAPSISSK